MANWQELQAELEKRFQVIEKSEESISVGLSWDDGRVQKVNLQLISFGGEPASLITSPLVPYSREAADFLLTNIGMAIKRTDDGFLSTAHTINHETMNLASCVAVVSAVAESTDELEKEVTGGTDAGLHGVHEDILTDNDVEDRDEIIGPGQYIVGRDVEPGMYRFAGYVARLDSEMNIITNESVRSGLGLVQVLKHDAYFEISGEAIRLEHYPTYDVLAQDPRGGIYLVGVDIPAGKYRIHGDGRSAYYATYDRKMQRLNNDLNMGSLIMTIQPSVYAVEFSGRLEQI
jgi:hypothetical protein